MSLLLLATLSHFLHDGLYSSECTPCIHVDLDKCKVSTELKDLFFTDVTAEVGELFEALIQSIVNGETMSSTVTAFWEVQIGDSYLIRSGSIWGDNCPVTL